MEACQGCKKQKFCFDCDGCHKKICKQCENLTSTEIKCLELKERTMIFYCGERREGHSIKLFKDILKEKNKIIESKNNIIEMLEREMEKYRNGEKTNMYSQVVKKSKEAILTVKPRDTNQQSRKTKDDVQDKINPTLMGTTISKLKYTKNGGVAISCEEKSVENMKSVAEKQLGKEYEVAILKKINPKLRIFNVNKKDVNDNDEFIEKIVFHNHINKEKQNFMLEIVHKQDSKLNQRNCHLILEMDTETYTEMNTNDYIQTGWKGCKYEDYISVTQCYKCWKFGHKANRCKSLKNVCAHCSSTEHVTNECNSNSKCCVNCKYAIDKLKVNNLTCSHSAFDKQCESYKRIYNQVKMKINFPEIFENNKNE